MTGNEVSNVETNKQLLHPISAQWVDTKYFTNPICLTKFQIQNKETNILNNYPCKQNVNNYWGNINPDSYKIDIPFTLIFGNYDNCTKFKTRGHADGCSSKTNGNCSSNVNKD